MINNTFEECIKCQKDFFYFVEKFVKINNWQKPHLKEIPFEMYDFRKRLVKAYEEHRFVSVKKFRQGGFTTLTLLYALWQCMFSHNKKYLFLTVSDREAICMSDTLKRVINCFPDQLKAMLTLSNDHLKQFNLTNSQILFRTPTSMRSVSFTDLVIDEAAFISNMDSHWESLYPIIFSSLGKVFVVSSVNGMRNWFAETHLDAVDKKNLFYAFECSYHEHPEYNSVEWVNKMKENLGERGFLQEVECCFLGSEPREEDHLRYKLGKIHTNMKLNKDQMLKQIASLLFEEF